MCRAWVNFNGTGTVAINASGNVSSITDNGTGNYTVNFTTAMSDTNYVTNVTGGIISTSVQSCIPGTGTTATGSIYVFTSNGANAASDFGVVNVSIFR
jgi:uncharacterized protein (AIM24 family)